MPRRRAVPIPADRRAGRAVLVLALIAVLASCSSAVPISPATSAGAAPSSTSLASATPVDSTAVYAEVAAQVEALRGLKATKSVAPVLVTPEDLRARLAADFDQANSAAGIEATQRTLIALGMLPAGLSLRQLVVDFRSKQATAYYSGVDGQIYVVTGGGTIGPAQRAAYARELTRALQDQTYHLGAPALDETHEGDQSLAHFALIEGDAASTENSWMQQYLTLDELGTVMAQASDPAAIAAFQNAPAYLRETASFANQDGVGFVIALLAHGGYRAVNDSFADPPESTADILDPQGYINHAIEIAAPLELNVERGLSSQWQKGGRDSLGKLRLGIWLRLGGLSSPVEDAAQGWTGDRLEVVFGPNDATALAISARFDNESDARAFADVASIAVQKAAGVGRVAHAVGSVLVSIAIGPDDGVVSALLGQLGA